MTDTPDTERSGPDPIEEAILRLVAAAPEGRSIAPERFNRKFGHVRQAAIRLAKDGKVTILRKGKPVEDPENFKGVWRIGRA